eukprot:5963881-Pleurochrysis_carterae.AAC.2
MAPRRTCAVSAVSAASAALPGDESGQSTLSPATLPPPPTHPPPQTPVLTAQARGERPAAQLDPFSPPLPPSRSHEPAPPVWRAFPPSLAQPMHGSSASSSELKIPSFS